MVTRDRCHLTRSRGDLRDKKKKTLVALENARLALGDHVPCPVDEIIWQREQRSLGLPQFAAGMSDELQLRPPESPQHL